MSIRWKCPQCSKKLAIAARKSGSAIRCPTCHASITVPAECSEATASKPEAQPWFLSSAIQVEPARVAPAVPEPVATAIEEPVTAIEPEPEPVPVPVPTPIVCLVAKPGPDLKLRRARRLVAIGGGAAGLLLLAAGIGLAWLQTPTPGQAAAEPTEVRVAEAVIPSPAVAVVRPEPAQPAAPAVEPLPAEAAPVVAQPVAPAAAVQPAEVPVARAEPAEAEPAPRRRGHLTADDLREQLRQVPELDFYPHIDKLRKDAYANSGRAQQQQAAALLLGRAPPDPAGLEERMLQPLATTPMDFASRVNAVVLKEARNAGLPIRSDVGCRVEPHTAKEMDFVSSTLRQLLVTGNADPVGGRGAFKAVLGGGFGGAAAAAQPVDPDRHRTVKDWCTKNHVEKYPGGLATLSQMLQAEEDAIRLVLVGQLAKIDSRESSSLLARRALFDLSPEVRRASTDALKKRRPEAYRGVLLAGLRYPWAPAANHAAEALLRLDDKGAVPSLLQLLDKPDPAQPSYDAPTNSQRVRELVRLNHMRNCYVCHAASTSASDLVRGLVPKVGGAVLPLYPTKCACGDFVQAQITYLRQDFSVVQRMEGDTSPWPEQQRYDYVVRSRKATAEEIQAAKEQAGASYPQRNAVLNALRGLTGRDAGTTSEEWKKAISGAKEEPLPAAPNSAPLPGGLLNQLIP